MSKTFPPRKRLAKYGKELYFFLSGKAKVIMITFIFFLRKIKFKFGKKIMAKFDPPSLGT